MSEPSPDPPAKPRRPRRGRSPVTMESIAEKVRAKTTNGDPAPPRAPEPEPEYPSIEEVAAAAERGAIPPAETNPDLSGRVHMTPADVALDSEPDLTVRNFRDLMDRLGGEFAGGEFEVYVERTGPRGIAGMPPCTGVMQPIRQPLSEFEFASAYGGGTYRLRLYGPPRRGGARDPRTGKIMRVPLSSWIALTLSHVVNPPRYELLVGYGDEQNEENMVVYPTSPGGGALRPPFSRPMSTGDARGLEVSYAHERDLLDRREKAEREVREREERIRQEADARARAETAPIASVWQDTQSRLIEVLQRNANDAAAAARREADRERERAEAERKRAEQAQNRPTDMQAFGTTVAELLKAVAPKDDGGSRTALEQAQKELQRLLDQHSKERETLLAQHREALDRRDTQHREALDRRDREHAEEMKRAEERVREAEKRADERVKDREARAEENARERIRVAEERQKDAERRAEERIKEAEGRADKSIRDVREEMKKAVDEANRYAQTRLDDERRNHDRDLKAQESASSLRLEAQKNTYEMRITTLNDQITQMRAECERLRAEAESAKDLPGQVEKFKKTAESLGMTDGSGPAPPESFKDLLMQLAPTLIPELPNILNSAGDTVRALRGQPAAGAPTPAWQGYAAEQSVQRELPPPLRGASGDVYQAPRMRFGTEDGVDFGVPVPDSPTPRAAPPAGSTSAALTPEQAAAEQARMFPQAPAPKFPGQPQAPQPQAPAPPSATAPLPQISAQQALAYRPLLEGALQSGEPPAQIARQIIAQAGPQMAVGLCRAMPVERIVSVVQASPGGATSPIVRRDGQRFLREVWQEIAKQARALGVA